jgi:hypothetical protein
MSFDICKHYHLESFKIWRLTMVFMDNLENINHFHRLFFQFDLKLTLEVAETVIQFLKTFKVSQDQNLHHT